MKRFLLILLFPGLCLAEPATVIRATRNVGHCTDERVLRSSPSASIPFHRSSKFDEMVISLTG